MLILYNPYIIIVASWGQVDFYFGFWLHDLDFPGYAHDITRISLQTLDLQIHTLNSLTSWPHMHLAAFQPVTIAASHQIRHTHGHVHALISFDGPHTTDVFLKYIKQRWDLHVTAKLVLANNYGLACTIITVELLCVPIIKLTQVSASGWNV